jgi:hypothetical protein
VTVNVAVVDQLQGTARREHARVQFDHGHARARWGGKGLCASPTAAARANRLRAR